ncbi:hypothetical protein JXE04_02795 [Patescibacteria group bacterium]|nr:hypothetical protein [Patescibacteria group bacterium]
MSYEKSLIEKQDAPSNEEEGLNELENEFVDSTPQEKEALDSAIAEEESVPSQIASISEEIKEFRSPEEIKAEIERLENERVRKMKLATNVYKSLTQISSRDTGFGSLASLSEGISSTDKLEKEFPGISKAFELMSRAKKKNSTGLKFWKNPELGDFEANAIKAYLINGEIGRFSSPGPEDAAKKAIKKFLSENKDVEFSGAIKEVFTKTNMHYKKEISNLEKQLS